MESKSRAAGAEDETAPEAVPLESRSRLWELNLCHWAPVGSTTSGFLDARTPGQPRRHVVDARPSGGDRVSHYFGSSMRILVRESDVTISISRPGSMMFTTTEPVPLTSTLVAPTRPEYRSLLVALAI